MMRKFLGAMFIVLAAASIVGSAFQKPPQY